MTRTPWTIGTGQRQALTACASWRPASSPAAVHVLPTASTIRFGGGASPASICSASSNAAARAPNVPIGVAPPGGITIACGSRRAIASPANGTSITDRSRTSSQPVAMIAPAFSAAHGLGAWGNSSAAPSRSARAACSSIAITWFEP